MKVIVVMERSPKQRFLVDLSTKRLAREVKGLVDRRMYSKAIVTALAKGRFEKEVGEGELTDLSASLILSENNANWDLK